MNISPPPNTILFCIFVVSQIYKVNNNKAYGFRVMMMMM